MSQREIDADSLKPFLFVCIVIALVGYGLIALYSASYDEALRHNLPTYYYFLRQAGFAVLGFIAFAIVRFIPFTWIKRAIPIFLVVSLLLMIVTLTTDLGVSRLGARRWIQIGPLPSFQPSELLKVSVILYIASVLSQRTDQEKKGRFSLIAALGIVLLSALLIVLQRDYSTTLVFLLVALAMFVAGGVAFHFIALGAFGIGVPAFIFLFLEPYRIRRLVSFLFPSIDPSGLNWQVQNSLKAMSSGGIFGKGLGNGVYKLGIIPEVQSDFIFASIVEELGFIGVLLFFLLFISFAILGFGAAYRHGKAGNQFTSLVAFGVTFMILWQAIVHVAVVSSLLPPTGIPLPFFSQGGTNLFMVLGECGLLYRCINDEAQESIAHG
jgi:cell division protein FtsW